MVMVRTALETPADMETEVTRISAAGATTPTTENARRRKNHRRRIPPSCFKPSTSAYLFLLACWYNGVVSLASDDPVRVFVNNTNSREQGPAPPGYQSDSFQARIYGGEQVEDESLYPYFIDWNGCAASLIYPDIALTAAHCQGDRGPAMVGSYERDATSSEAVGARVTKMIPHPDFYQQEFNGLLQNDIMVVQLGGWVEKRTVPRDDGLESPKADDPLTIMGLGRLTGEVVATVGNETYLKYPTVLQTAEVSYVDNTTCAETYEGLNNDLAFCASSGQSDSCYGDSGGPVIDLEGTQVGIVSFGIGCGNSRFPGGYTRVSHYNEWIEQQICAGSQNPPPSCEQEGDGRGGKRKRQYKRLRIDLKHDLFPEDITWQLIHPRRGIVARSKDYTVKEYLDMQGVIETVFVDVKHGQYTFQIEDFYGDGMGIGDYGKSMCPLMSYRMLYQTM